MNFYVLGEDKSLNEAYTKDQMDNQLAGINTNIDDLTDTVDNYGEVIDGLQQKITSGSAAPSGGNNGDIYIQY